MKLAFEIKDYLRDKAGTAIVNTPYHNAKLFDVLSVIIKNLYVLAGIILFFFLIIGGVGMILNAGNTEKQKQSSQTLSSAVLGFLIMFAAYWLIKLVEIIFGQQIFKL